MACRHIDDIDVCIGVWLFDCLTVECEVEMVVPQLQPQEPKLKPPDSCRENETKSPHVRCLSEIPCRPRLWAPEPQIESLEQKPWRGTPVDRKLRRVAHLFQYTRVHILRLLASSPMSASSSSQVFHQRNELILVQNPWQDPSQDLTSKGKYFSRIFMAFWYLCKVQDSHGFQSETQSSHRDNGEKRRKRSEDAKMRSDSHIMRHDPQSFAGPWRSGGPVRAHTSSLGSSCRASILGNPSASDMSKIHQPSISNVWNLGFKTFLGFQYFPSFQCFHFLW